jgi:CDP-glucose 4,6-dehydratase
MATEDPMTCYQTNIMGTVNVMEAARECGHVNKIVVASSDKAYGVHENLPYKEDFALLASDPYSTSKSCTDLIAQSYAYTYDMNTSIVRSGNIFGPGDLNKSRIIPGSILRILDGERPVIYSGVGNYKREFMYIDDVLDAYLSVQDRGLKGEAYNVGGSGFQNIFDTVNIIIEEMGVDIEPQVLEKDFIEIKEQYLDQSKLEALGWKCKYDIRQGIKAAVPWYVEYHEDPSKFYWAQ